MKTIKRPFIFKIKNYLLYYFRYTVIGMFLGFLIVFLWKSFLPDFLVADVNEADLVMVRIYEKIILLFANPFYLLFTAPVVWALLLTINKCFLRCLKISLIALGVVFWIYFNNIVLWESVSNLQTWYDPQSTITIIFRLAFLIVIFDILTLFVGVAVKFIKSFFLNLNIESKIEDKKIGLNISALLNKFKSKSVEDDEVEKPNFSDAPLKDLKEINNMRSVKGNENLFSTFLKQLNDVIQLVIREDSDKNYTRSICLDGPWGSGKTSLTNIAEEEMQSKFNSKITWIKFNPWNFSNPSELIKDFFETLNKELIKKYRIDLDPNLKFYVDLVTPVIEATGLMGSLRSILLEAPFLKQNNLIESKEEIRKKLISLPDKIVIVLDDIDRLDLDEIEIVLRLVRQLSNFPNILFILPFDYNRVSSIILKQKGEAYSGFLGKIVNSRIRLVGYSYRELEAIFINFISRSANATLRDVLVDALGIYINSRIRFEFEDISITESKDTNTDPTLKPMVGYSRNIFSVIYPDKPFMNTYVYSVAATKKVIEFYLNDYYSDIDSLTKGIVENFAVIEKLDMVKTISPLRPQIDQDIDTLNPSQDQRTEIDNLWTTFIDSLKNNQNLDTIERVWNQFKLYELINHISTNKMPSNVFIEQIDELIVSYINNYENSNELKIKIKDWLIGHTTPRQIKDLARAVTDELSVNDIVNQKQVVFEIVKDFASTQ